MLEKGIGIDSGLLDVLVGMYLSQNRIEEACEFLKEKVENDNVKPWRSSYKGVIDKLVEIKKDKEALCLVQMMKKQYHSASADAERNVQSLKYYYPNFSDVIYAFYGLPGLRGLKSIILRQTRMNPW
ncbi:unnamed protein product [Eruca vesicaria subsp. sativa]|uniref:Pentatricopeptide repeat-containing protein n=1 Tax=Eruca vesicaria subsp. sativa TaxID=29727 RepID=A0ABC8M5H5_ERUVS|nr:unnamed protein product [Eruca vesicaria subsp. sativa]